MFLRTALLSTSLVSFASILAADDLLDMHPHKLNFSLSEVGYEYQKNDSIYCGIDFKIAPIWNLKKGNADKPDHWTNLETRIGYQFKVSEKHTYIPYLAFGMSHFKFDNKTFDLDHLSYACIGSKFMHSFGDIFEMGVHAKAHRNVMITFAADCTPTISAASSKRVAVENTDWKIELRLPCVWHIGATKEWEIQFEPYYMQLPTFKKTEFYGTRVTCGHRF